VLHRERKSRDQKVGYIDIDSNGKLQISRHVPLRLKKLEPWDYPTSSEDRMIVA